MGSLDARRASRRAVEQRGKRLANWRQERVAAAGVGPDDRIVHWIDRRDRRGWPIRRIRLDPPLVSVRLPRSEVRELTAAPGGRPAIAPPGLAERVARSRGHAGGRAEGRAGVAGLRRRRRGQAPPAPLDRLLPPVPETDAIWLGRRAATEIAIDTGLRFLRYQDMVIPDTGPGNSRSTPWDSRRPSRS